jgi:hypothetical protein
MPRPRITGAAPPVRPAIPELKKNADHRPSVPRLTCANTTITPKFHVLKKILEETRTHSTLFFHQEKSFHDH